VNEIRSETRQRYSLVPYCWNAVEFALHLLHPRLRVRVGRVQPHRIGVPVLRKAIFVGGVPLVGDRDGFGPRGRVKVEAAVERVVELTNERGGCPAFVGVVRGRHLRHTLLGPYLSLSFSLGVFLFEDRFP